MLHCCHPIVPRSYCLVQSHVGWPNDDQALEFAREIDQPGWNTVDSLAELNWRFSGRKALATSFRRLSIDRPEAHLLRFSMADRRGPILMNLNLNVITQEHVYGRLWQRSVIDGNTLTLTKVDEVCVVSLECPRDMAVQVTFLIPGWPGDAHLLSKLLQRLRGH